MASPDKSPVLNIPKEFDAAQQQVAREANWYQSSYDAPTESIVDEGSENPRGPGNQDQPPKALDVEEDLTRSLDTLKTPITAGAWRTIGKPLRETAKLENLKEKEVMEVQLERREREIERQERELDRRGREIDRRERELERRQREFDRDRARWTTDIGTAPQWTTAIEALKNKIDTIILKERMNSEQREMELEARVIRKVNEVLEREHQIMQMSDNEVNDMIEDTVGYLLQKDEDIADRVRFQSLVYLAQEKLAIEAGLQPGTALEPLPTAWIIAIGPSVDTEDRYIKAMELLKKGDQNFSDATVKLMDCKPAMEFLVEYTSHHKKEQSFAPGRIPREAYLESIERQVKQSGVNGEALTLVVDFVYQDQEIFAKPSEA